MISQAYQAPVKISSIRDSDRLEKSACFSFMLQGNGSLKQVPDPFETMHNLFVSDSWIANMRYDADGHGGSSFAYEKENRICLISVAIDSACDDTEKGHIPNKFWLLSFAGKETRIRFLKFMYNVPRIQDVALKAVVFSECFV